MSCESVIRVKVRVELLCVELREGLVVRNPDGNTYVRRRRHRHNASYHKTHRRPRGDPYGACNASFWARAPTASYVWRNSCAFVLSIRSR